MRGAAFAAPLYFFDFQFIIDEVPQPVIYLDHHATTPCDPRVVETMLPFFSEHYGNPASITHAHGRKASMALEDARIAMARFLGVLPPEVYFTAGATESNNIALNLLQPGDHFVTGATEHKSILTPAERLETKGVAVTILRPDGQGFLHPDAVRGALRPETRLVSVEAANGEIGTIQPIGELCAICLERGVLFHTDATQALETLWRLLEPPTDRRAQFRAVYRDPFNDALALLELYALSSGRYVDVFRQWQAFAQRVRRAQEEGEQAAKPRRRRRRR